MPIVERLKVAPVQTSESGENLNGTLLEEGLVVFSIIQGLLDKQDKDRQIRELDPLIFLPPPGLIDEPFYVGKNGKDSKNTITEDFSTENFLRFELGNYYYYMDTVGKDSRELLLIRRKIPKKEIGLTVSEKSGTIMTPKPALQVEFAYLQAEHTYYNNEKDGEKGESDDVQIAVNRVGTIIAQIELDLDSGKLPKRA